LSEIDSFGSRSLGLPVYVAASQAALFLGFRSEWQTEQWSSGLPTVALTHWIPCHVRHRESVPWWIEHSREIFYLLGRKSANKEPWPSSLSDEASWPTTKAARNRRRLQPRFRTGWLPYGTWCNKPLPCLASGPERSFPLVANSICGAMRALAPDNARSNAFSDYPKAASDSICLADVQRERTRAWERFWPIGNRSISIWDDVFDVGLDRPECRSATTLSQV